MKKWTIAFVNYKTAVYLNWQFKILFENNNPNDFDVIIIDNSRPTQKEELELLAKKYNDKYNNIKIIPYSPKKESASGQHGEAMTKAIKLANSQYFLAQDPDFFFVKNNYLNYMASFLEKNMVAIGAPYPRQVGLGNPKFPALYGCAHPLELIKNLDCNAEESDEKRQESLDRFPNKDYSFDVGYKIREALSTEDNDKNFISFNQIPFNELSQRVGEHSYEAITKEYSFNKEVICYHLFRGSFTSEAQGNKDINKDLSEQLLEVRDKIGQFFYTYIKNGKKPKHKNFLKYYSKVMFSYIYKKERHEKRIKYTFFSLIKTTKKVV